MKNLCIAAVLAAGLASQALAQIQVVITPAGSALTAWDFSSTVWTFSGSATYNATIGNSKFVNQTSFNADTNTAEWKTSASLVPVAEYVGSFYNNFNVAHPGAGADITIGGNAYTIDGVVVDHDGSGDDIALFISGGSSEPLTQGTVVSATGSKGFAIDYSRLVPGTYSFSHFDDQGTLNMKLTIVPEPGEWAVLTGAALGVAGLVLRRRRQA